ncbi:hypothetical protein Leryth_005846 [Lithospermum erythrorhizon]|nr:hypothetical protein Leryth_005846 [Lithospermum erythrorhizon]
MFSSGPCTQSQNHPRLDKFNSFISSNLLQLILMNIVKITGRMEDRVCGEDNAEKLRSIYRR